MTEDRPEFTEWVLWNFGKQDHANRELVVVDSSRTGSTFREGDGVRVVSAPPGTTVPAKRNLALSAARGEILTWFDDDDWQHPRKLSLLAGALEGRMLAGSRLSWFVDLGSSRSGRFAISTGLLFNSVGFTRELAGLRFDEGRRKASDTPWLLTARRRARGREAVVEEPLFFWLSHARNLSNPSGRRPATEALAAVRTAIGAEAWGDTDGRLEALRVRVAAPAPRPARRVRPVRPRVCVAVTTYDRPESLGALLDDLEREARSGDVDVRVYDDASPGRGYAGIERRLRERGWTYVRAARNHGKEEWWTWWNAILADLRSTSADTFVLLQDDMRLCERFVERALESWTALADRRKASLLLHVDETAANGGRVGWTPVRERRVGSLVHCGWVDLSAFVCGRALFDALRWRLDPVPANRWRGNPLLGSGVGAQISHRLHRRGLTMYRLDESLAVHVDGPSRMNPEARRRSPMRTVRYVGGEHAAKGLAAVRTQVTASLATVPSRERALATVVESLLPQVDALGVYLNGHERVPGFLDDPKIRVAESRGHGDRGDAGKFFWSAEISGHHLLCDDDIRYPPDYVAELVAGIERYERRAVVGFHGATLHDRIADYYRSRTLLHFRQAQPTDVPVHVLGTGVTGYHSSTIAVSPADFHAPNMADIWLAISGQRQRVPFISLRRRSGWLSEIPGCAADSIYRRAIRSRTESEPTRAVRAQGRWQLHTAVHANGVARPRMVRVAVRGPSRRAELVLPEHDHITVAVQRSRTYYESDLLEAIRARGRHGLFVDVGAHYGNHTVYFALECGAERVVSVEPNPPAFAGLLENVELNGLGASVTPLAVAAHPALRAVRVVEGRWRPRAGTGILTNSGTAGVAEGGSLPAAPLDEILEPFGPVSVLKVDVEGLGPEILASAGGALERDRPLVAVETATSEAFERVRALLAPLGYAPAGRYCWTPTWLWSAD